jgi:hypothetical protein
MNGVATEGSGLGTWVVPWVNAGLASPPLLLLAASRAGVTRPRLQMRKPIGNAVGSGEPSC